MFLPYPVSFSFAYRYPSVGRYQNPAPNFVRDFLAILDVVIHVLLWAFAIGCDVALYNREVDLVNEYAATHTNAPDPSLTIVGSLSLFALSLTLLSVLTFVGGTNRSLTRTRTRRHIPFHSERDIPYSTRPYESAFLTRARLAPYIFPSPYLSLYVLTCCCLPPFAKQVLSCSHAPTTTKST